MEEKTKLTKRIGENLNLLRKIEGLTLKQLGEFTQLSSPFLSKIENGLVMPSIPALQVISDALKVDISYFFNQEEEKNYFISRAGERKVKYSKRGAKRKFSYALEFLAEGIENPFMQPTLYTLYARNSNELEAVAHDGQEFLYVIEGKLELTLGERVFVLKKGDSAYFKGDIPHKGISLSKRPAKTLNVHLTWSSL